jgi:predicted RNase H-like HicB family nuclease
LEGQVCERARLAFPGAHIQGATQEERRANLQEVVAMLLEDGEPALRSLGS